MQSFFWHVFDDYSGIEADSAAQSAFTSFEQLNALLGFKVKASKKCPPAPSQIVQGVQVRFHDSSVSVETTERRIASLRLSIDHYLGSTDCPHKKPVILPVGWD